MRERKAADHYVHAHRSTQAWTADPQSLVGCRAEFARKRRRSLANSVRDGMDRGTSRESGEARFPSVIHSCVARLWSVLRFMGRATVDQIPSRSLLHHSQLYSTNSVVKRV